MKSIDFLRGAVRPISVLAVVGAVIGFLATGQLEAAKYMTAFGSPIVAWWFASRPGQPTPPPDEPAS